MGSNLYTQNKPEPYVWSVWYQEPVNRGKGRWNVTNLRRSSHFFDNVTNLRAVHRLDINNYRTKYRILENWE